MVLGLLALTAIPTTIGVAEGVSEQRNQNREQDDAARMAKFHVDVSCDAPSRRTKDVHGKRLVLRGGKVWIDEEVSRLRSKKGGYTVKAFYIDYPDEERKEKVRGLVTKCQDDPPMLNWLYVDKETLEVKYGNRTQSREHHVGPWDWTDEEDGHAGVMLDGWEGFVAVKEDSEGPGEGNWAVYFDKKDDGLKGVVDGKKRRMLEIRLIRTICEDQEV
ncbi:MAG: hypothetical protein Q9227_003921 [Pyrenula ochraceoflavens]